MRRLLLALFAGAALFYARFNDAERLQVVNKTLRLPRLPSEFDGYRIAHISDLHIDNWLTRRKLDDDFKTLQEYMPDLIVFTGDFVTFDAHGSASTLIEKLSQLHAPDGVFAVPGNHDYWQRGAIDTLRRVMRESGMVDLSNTYHTIQREEATLHIAGVDDLIAHQARLNLVLNALPEDGCAILLAHEPDFADVSAATGRFDLQLSGHTHGGQLRVPFYGPLFTPTHGKRYKNGLYYVHDMWLYVNRGLGTTGVPLRLNCPPELTIFTLKVP